MNVPISNIQLAPNSVLLVMSTRLRIGSISVLLLLVVAGCSDDDPVMAPPPEDSVRYQVTFTSTWSAATHPDGFPANPHFSPLIGATHCSCMSFWEVGELASPGIKAMAELGATNALASEVATAQGNGGAENLLTGTGIGVSPGMASLEFDVSLDFPAVTLVSMVAPSPDWFVGVSGLDLFDGSEWVDSLVIELYPYDAGTDSGSDYTSPNQATQPPAGIFQIDSGPLWVDGALPSVGTFTFVRQ
ncbi:MAG: elongation factor Ts [candidate division Zixibacteria bacterium]|nr:elongation factor Ts [candidate division Zixibacteria bacterium]